MRLISDELNVAYVIVTFGNGNVVRKIISMDSLAARAWNEANDHRMSMFEYYKKENIEVTSIDVEVYVVAKIVGDRLKMLRKPIMMVGKVTES